MKMLSKVEFLERLRKLSEPDEHSDREREQTSDPIFGQGNIVGTLDIGRLNEQE